MLAGAARAAEPDIQEATRKYTELFSGCAGGAFTQNSSTGMTMETATSPWTGPCVNGLKDGRGTFIVKTRNDTKSDLLGVTTDETEVSGFYVRGAPAGLSCNVTISSTMNGKPFQSPIPNICTFALASAASPYLTKQTDGNWRVSPDMSSGPLPDFVASASDVDALSETLIARAKSGAPNGPVELKVNIPAAADLIQSGQFTFAVNNEPLQLKSKRVAIVLTSNTEKEFSRYNEMRQALFNTTSGIKDYYGHRKEFLARSDPNNILLSTSAGFLLKTAGVQPADDFSVLNDSGVDYVALVDWHFNGNFNLTKAQFRALPVCAKDADASQCPLFFQDVLSIVLIAKDLKIVRAWSISSGKLEKLDFLYTSNTLDELFDQIYDNTIAWDKETGLMRDSVKNWLEQAR